MEKVIRIGDKDVRFRADASTLWRYSEKFGGDWFKEFQEFNGKEISMTGKPINALTRIAYIMAKQASPNDVPEDPVEWLSQFEMFDLYPALPQLVELWGLNTVTTAKPKKK